MCKGQINSFFPGGIVTILMYDIMTSERMVLQLCNKSESVTSYILHMRSKTEVAVLLVITIVIDE